MRNKRAQGLTINTIILLVLGVIVLAILTYIFYNTSRDYGSQTSGASSQIKDQLCSAIGTCAKSTPGNSYSASPEPEPEGGWIDCNTADGYSCYTRGSR